MTKPLTDSVVSTLAPKRGQVGWREIADGGCRGLRLRISTAGEKVWAVRHMIGGKRMRHTIGAYPAVSLAGARQRAAEYLAAGRDGVSAEQVDARTKAQTMTVKQAHADYIASAGASLRASTRTLKEGMFRDHVAPVVGARLLRTIRRGDLIEVIGKVAAKGYKVQCNRVFSELMALLRWCEQKGYVDGVPSLRKRDLRSFGAAKEQPRRRALADAEIGEVWRAAADLGGLTEDFLRLLLLSGQRRDEVRLMRIEHVDLKEALWTIPAAAYKTGMDHAVPLSDTALAIVRRRVGDRRAGPVLAGRGDEEKPFNGAGSALRRLRAAMEHRSAFTLHDMRRTCRTTLSRLGVDEETAELVIGHVPQGMGKVYNLYDRLAERREALARWDRFVLSLGEGSGNVLQMVQKEAEGAAA